jgi:anaerobic sulfite reductase subunit B
MSTLVTHVDTPGPLTAPLAPVAHRLVRTRRWTRDTTTLWLEAPDGPVPWLPGQFSMLSLPGIGEAAISISGADAAGHHAYTIRAVGGVTHALTTRHVGDLVGFRGVYGTVWPVELPVGSDLLLVAGGLGLAPLRPALTWALEHRDRFRDVTLLVGARTPEDLLFREELLGWGGREDVEVQITVDRANDTWMGRVGLITRFLPGLDLDLARTTALVCGPEIMMRNVGRELVELGLPPTAIHATLERTMRCGVGWCGHCQLGPLLVCRDGPVFPWTLAGPLMEVREL